MSETNRIAVLPQADRWPDLIVIMGVSGCGKSTVGELLARRISHAFADADDYHPAVNVEKMRSGQPLNDSDRQPWLATLNRLLADARTSRRPLVLACSALRQSYRDTLSQDLPDLCWVHLTGSFELITSRLAMRRGHYMPATLLRSQFDALELPARAVVVPVDGPAEAIVETIVAAIGGAPAQ